MSKLVLTDEQIQNLPAKVQLVGFAINRTVYIDGKLLGDPKALPRYDWGYLGEDCKTLAYVFLNQYLDIKMAQKWANTFMHHIVSKLSVQMPAVKSDEPELTNEKMIELEVLKKKSLNENNNFAINIDVRGYLAQLVADQLPDLSDVPCDVPAGWEFFVRFIEPATLQQPEAERFDVGASFTSLTDKQPDNPLLK